MVVMDVFSDDESDNHNMNMDFTLGEQNIASITSWKKKIIYEIGNKVSYKSKVYSCLIKHKSGAQNNPGKVPFIWQEEKEPEPEPEQVSPKPIPVPTPTPTPKPSPDKVHEHRRGLWVWDGYENILKPDVLLQECKRIKITDVYLYITPMEYTRIPILRTFMKKLSSANIRAWGLDGGRSYFNDASGPLELYRNINSMIAYNVNVEENERFYGFQTDNEPDNYSGKYLDTFHNDVRTQDLSKTTGGLWTKSEYEDRMFILKDWLSIQKQCTNLLRKYGLASGGAFPTWLDDYYGEELTVNFDGSDRSVMKHMMTLVDDYCLMSYQTDLNKVYQRVIDELIFADSLSRKVNVFPGLETHRGRGANVTYGDHPSKNSKSAVLNDIGKIELKLETYKCFAGVNIHDWVGWKQLKN